jgi:hypothetical protein
MKFLKLESTMTPQRLSVVPPLNVFLIVFDLVSSMYI